jgi:glutamate synthase domain-containing protein 1
MLAEIKGLNEECGVFGIWGHEEAPQITYYGLHSLQHRGQEGAGIVATDGEKMSAHKGQGLITEVFQNGELKKVKGKGSDRPRPLCNGGRRRLRKRPAVPFPFAKQRQPGACAQRKLSERHSAKTAA